MSHQADFDVDAVLATLSRLSDMHPSGSPEEEALRVAAVALVYVRELQKLGDYREYFRRFYTPPSEAITVSQAFSTRDEADAWLVSGRAAEGELVRIAGQGFRVIDGPKGLRFLRTPLPEEMRTPDQA
jgi:hypothetical protein